MDSRLVAPYSSVAAVEKLLLAFGVAAVAGAAVVVAAGGIAAAA